MDKALTRAIHDSLIEEMYWFRDRREGRHYPCWLQAVSDVDRTAIEKTMGRDKRGLFGVSSRNESRIFGVGSSWRLESVDCCGEGHRGMTSKREPGLWWSRVCVWGGWSHGCDEGGVGSVG